MATVIAAVAVGALLAVVVPKVARWRPSRSRLVECAACGKPLPVSRAVIVHGEVQAHREGFSATVAEYHRRCARRAGLGVVSRPG